MKILSGMSKRQWAAGETMGTNPVEDKLHLRLGEARVRQRVGKQRATHRGSQTLANGFRGPWQRDRLRVPRANNSVAVAMLFNCSTALITPSCLRPNQDLTRWSVLGNDRSRASISKPPTSPIHRDNCVCLPLCNFVRTRNVLSIIVRFKVFDRTIFPPFFFFLVIFKWFSSLWFQIDEIVKSLFRI